jgi:hypothetical protein
MRSAPPSRLLAANCLIKLIVSGLSFGLLELALDLRLQIMGKSSRCQRSSVSGWRGNVSYRQSMPV